jgi:hypothetical protein
MTDQDFQNQPINDQNPLSPPNPGTGLKVPDNTPLPNADPKIKLLKKLGIVVGVLLVLSLILPAILPKNPSTNHPKPTIALPEPTLPVSPVQNPNSLGQFQSTFDQLESEIKNTSPNFPPPQYDADISP